MDKLPIPLWVYIMMAGSAILCFAIPINNSFAQNTTTVPTAQLLGQTMDVWLATIGSGISLALLALKWLDSWLRSRKQSAFNDKLIEVVGKAKNSIQGSDEWIKENIVNHQKDIQDLFGVLSQSKTIDSAVQDPRFQAIIKRANVSAEEAKATIDQYYGWASKVTGIDSKNTQVAKLAEIEQSLTPAGPSAEATTISPPASVAATSSKPDSDAI